MGWIEGYGMSWLMFGSFVFGLRVVGVKSSISVGAVGITIGAWSAVIDQAVSDVRWNESWHR